MDKVLELMYNELIQYLNKEYKEDLVRYFNKQPNIIFHLIDNKITVKPIHDINMQMYNLDIGTSCVNLSIPKHLLYKDYKIVVDLYLNEMRMKLDIYMKKESVPDMLTYILLGDFKGTIYDDPIVDMYTIRTSYGYATHTFDLT